MVKKQEPIVVPEVAPKVPELKTHIVSLKGHGLCHGGVNGVPFQLPRGTEIVVPDNLYHILNDAGEIA